VDALVRALAALGLDGAAAVETTVDPGLQRDVEEILRGELASDPRLANGAVVVVDNLSGEVLAYVGSADFLDATREGQNDGARALRQPGSALKPFAYGLALARGFTPATVLSDAEAHLATAGGDWAPRNYDRRMHGPVRLRAALQNSYNVPAVRLAEALGPEAVLRVLRAAGFSVVATRATTPKLPPDAARRIPADRVPLHQERHHVVHRATHAFEHRSVAPRPGQPVAPLSP
jgi:penicillin-binding protein 1C